MRENILLDATKMLEAAKYVDEAKELANKVHNLIVVEGKSASAELMENLATANYRSAAAQLVLSSVEVVQPDGSAELDEKAAVTLLAMLNYFIIKNTNAKGPAETIRVLSIYSNWLESRILNMS